MSLEKVLRDRESRSLIQKEMNKRWNSALVSLSLNLPGKEKSPTWSRPLFEVGKQLCLNLPYPILEVQEFNQNLIIAVNGPHQEIKKKFFIIEENHPLGRFWDFDVFDPKLQKLSRKSPRSCYLCRNDAWICAKTRTHSQESLVRFIKKRIKYYFTSVYANYAYEALLEEVDCTPKPGLVDKRNTGAHKDMDHALFVKSAQTLKIYFHECVERGFSLKESNPKTFFQTLRPIGLEAEKLMLQTTQGVNTHKGAIFTLGLHCAAFGHLVSRGRIPNIENLHSLNKFIRKMCASTLKRELQGSSDTAGEKAYQKYKIAGIRDEAARGYPFPYFNALPFYLNELKLCNENTALVKTFLFLLMNTQDTNIIKRGGIDSLFQVQAMAKFALGQEPFELEPIVKMDNFFIENNLSPGGTADLLALVIFLRKSLLTSNTLLFETLKMHC